MCKNNTDITNPKMIKTKNERLTLLSKCAVCKNNKSKFIKEQETEGLLSSPGIRTNIPGLNILF